MTRRRPAGLSTERHATPGRSGSATTAQLPASWRRRTASTSAMPPRCCRFRPRPPQTRRQGVPADRHRHRHPVGDHARRRPVTAAHTIRFADHLVRTFRRLGLPVRGNAHRQRTRVGRRRLPRPPRSAWPRAPPHPAAISEPQRRVRTDPRHRAAGVLAPAFHRRRFTSIRQHQAEADRWLVRYHHRRRNRSDYMPGRTPAEILDSHRPRQAS